MQRVATEDLNQQEENITEPDTCCCYSLQEGSLWIGRLGILGGILSFMNNTAIWAADYADIQQTVNTKWLSENINGTKLVLTTLELTSLHAVDKLTLNVISILFGYFLMDGVHKKNESFLGVWIIFRIISSVNCFISGFRKNLITGEIDGWSWVVDFISMAIDSWFISVVYHHRKELQDEGDAETGARASMLYEIAKPNSVVTFNSEVGGRAPRAEIDSHDAYI